jgi:hypothetical protein
MYKTKEGKPKEPEFTTTFKTKTITNLHDVMRKVGSSYKAEAPIYERKTDRLLLNKGNSISEERFEDLKRRLSFGILEKRKSPYYTQTETTDIDFN